MMTEQTMKTILILGILLVTLLYYVTERQKLSFPRPHNISRRRSDGGHWAVSQTTGNKEIQADYVQIHKNSAGIMAAMADGIGKENTGKLCACLAVDTVLDSFEPYHILENPVYLFRTSFLEAGRRIQRTLENRRGGASLLAVYTSGDLFYYALAGNIRLALFRNGELIPISKGQTIDVLAMNAYQEGRLTKRETIWSLEETRIWNYLGRDGFHEIELCEPPIRLKPGDIILMTSCGIFTELSWAEMEDILAEDITLQEKADALVMAADKKAGQDKDNGSVLLLQAEVSLDEKDQF